MKSKIRLLLLFLLFTAMHIYSQSEGNFYTETIDNFSLQKNLQIDYDVDGLGNNTDSERLQRAINEVNLAGGGKIYIPQGTYKFGEVSLMSNVHLLIEHNSIIIPYIINSAVSLSIFSLGDNGASISNLSVRGVDGKYNVNLPAYVPGIRVFECGNVSNFYLADFTVNDNYTKFACVSMGISTFNNADYNWPMNGVVKNGSVVNAHYGYGLVQVQAAENILFKDLSGVGGSTLRVETGWTVMNDLQIGTANKIFGRNISCTNGNSAVQISPHAMHNGSVDIDGVTSVSSGFGVRIEGGFISSDYTNPNLTVGTFTSVKVKNINSTFGITAQLKSKHFKYLPTYRTDLITSISQDGGESVIGPSIASVMSIGDTYAENVYISNVTAIGFLCQKPIIGASDINSTMNCSPSADGISFDEGYIEQNTSLIIPFSNPNLKLITILNKESVSFFVENNSLDLSSKVNLINYCGRVLKTENLKNGINTINLAGLPNGIYLINLFNRHKSYAGKFVKR